jgi:hypothetical protein
VPPSLLADDATITAPGLERSIAHTPTPRPSMASAGAHVAAGTHVANPTPNPVAPPSSATYTPTVTVSAPPSPLANPLVLLGGFAIIAVLVVVVVLLLRNEPTTVESDLRDQPTAASGVIAEPTAAPTPVPVVQAAPSIGRAVFSTGGTMGDTVSVRADGLRRASGGSRYAAYLYRLEPGSSEPAEALRLGDLATDATGSGSLVYTSPDGTFLPAVYNGIALVLESAPAETLDLAGALYRGEHPLAVADALQAIFIETTLPAGDKPEYTGGLTDGLLAEATIARSHAGLAAGSSTTSAMRLHAEHTINIVNGTQIDYDGSGRGENPGRGYGIAYFADAIEQQLTAAATSEGASTSLQSQIELIRVCLGNIRTWSAELSTIEQELVAADDIEAAQPLLEQSTETANALIVGIDLNANGIVDPFEGECAIEQLALYGVSVANFDIREIEA